MSVDEDARNGCQAGRTTVSCDSPTSREERKVERHVQSGRKKVDSDVQYMVSALVALVCFQNADAGRVGLGSATHQTQTAHRPKSRRRRLSLTTSTTHILNSTRLNSTPLTAACNTSYECSMLLKHRLNYSLLFHKTYSLLVVLARMHVQALVMI